MNKTEDQNFTVSFDGVSSNVQRKKYNIPAIVLAIVALIAAIAAIVGFVLFASVQVPNDAAAKVNDSYITEASVSSWIAQYRAAHDLKDDEDFASALLSQNLNVGTFRQYAINQLALSMLVNQRAAQLGIVVSDDEVQEQIDAAMDDYAFGDETIWEETLESYGMTEDEMREQYRTNLAEQALYTTEVEHRDATDDEVLTYIETYLMGTTQKHACRIVFVGDEASDRAYACYESLAALQNAGEFNADVFAEAARTYSDEADSEETGGSFAWSGSSKMNDEIKDILTELDVGSFTAPEAITADDDAVEIIFCDEEYTFVAPVDGDEFDVSHVPEELLTVIEQKASDAAWDADCELYLAALLSDAKITYYPIPENATYDVSSFLAS